MNGAVPVPWLYALWYAQKKLSEHVVLLNVVHVVTSFGRMRAYCSERPPVQPLIVGNCIDLVDQLLISQAGRPVVAVVRIRKRRRYNDVVSVVTLYCDAPV